MPEKQFRGVTFEIFSPGKVPATIATKIPIMTLMGHGFREHAALPRVAPRGIASQCHCPRDAALSRLPVTIGAFQKRLSIQHAWRIGSISERMEIGCRLLRATFLRFRMDLYRKRGGQQTKLGQTSLLGVTISESSCQTLSHFRLQSQKASLIASFTSQPTLANLYWILLPVPGQPARLHRKWAAAGSWWS